VLVAIDLGRREAHAGGQLGLAQPERAPALAQSRADMTIDDIAAAPTAASPDLGQSINP
jgi:hypothetical protein